MYITPIFVKRGKESYVFRGNAEGNSRGGLYLFKM